MESRKKHRSNLPSWERILDAARRETPPRIDVRPGVRAALERAALEGKQNGESVPLSLLECILELFSRTAAKLTLGAAAVSAFAFAVIGASLVEPSDLEELGGLTDETTPVIDESEVEQDWTEAL